MPIEIKMPALSPTMEEGTLAKWLVKIGDTVKSGDILAEIETDKATMEFEAIDEGVVASIDVAEGTDGVKVGTIIATITGEDEDAPAAKSDTTATKDGAAPAASAQSATQAVVARPGDRLPDGGQDSPAASAKPAASAPAAAVAGAGQKDRVKASPLARRIAAGKGVELSGVTGSGPNGRIVRADIESAKPGAVPAAAATAAATTAAPTEAKPVWYDDSIPHTVEKLSNIRKTIARRLTEAKQTVPHIYLTVDVQLDALLQLRTDLNAALEARGVKLSVNDLLIKALGLALEATPKCNVTFLGNDLVSYSRADISVAVSTPSGLITPIIRDAARASMTSISTQMKELAALAKDNKLKPDQYQGGTASISNMGMYGIKQFDAVINPPQGMILAVGAGEKRPYVMGDALGVATVMSATGSFDHRAIDGADGAQLMKAFKALVEKPLGLVA